MFYVYEWFVIMTGEVFYVGKGCRNRYKALNSRRNKLFRFYVENFQCDSRIVKRFASEDEAYAYEIERIDELKKLGLAKANYNRGGGSYQSHVSDEMRDRYSKFNIMKTKEQRERFKANNPMKNRLVAENVARQTRKAVVLNGEYYDGVLVASRETGRCSTAIIKWCKRGYDDNGNPCHYATEKPKPVPQIKKTHPKATTPKSVVVDGVEYPTVLDGAKACGGNSSSLIKAIKGGRTYRNHIVSYGNQKPTQTKPSK